MIPKAVHDRDQLLGDFGEHAGSLFLDRRLVESDGAIEGELIFVERRGELLTAVGFLGNLSPYTVKCMMAETARDARSGAHRGVVQAAGEIHRKKVNLQEDRLAQMFPDPGGIGQNRSGAGQQVAKLREFGLALGEIAEPAGEPAGGGIEG